MQHYQAHFKTGMCAGILGEEITVFWEIVEAKLNLHKLNRIFGSANITIFLGQWSSNHKNSLHKYLRQLSSRAIILPFKCGSKRKRKRKRWAGWPVSMEEIFFFVKWKEFQGKQENISVLYQRTSWISKRNCKL